MTTEFKKHLSNGMFYVLTKDNDGREYHKVFYSETVNTCLAIGNKNYIIPARVNIGLRNGKSKFGEEIVVQLIKDGKIKETYEKRSPEEHIEFYLPKEMGVMFLNHCINCFKNNRCKEVTQMGLQKWDI